MFKSLHPLYKIDKSDNTYSTWRNEYIRDPFYHPTFTSIKISSKEPEYSYILMYFIDHNGRMDLVAKSIEAESAGYCPYDPLKKIIKQTGFQLKIINSQSDLKYDGEFIRSYAIDSLNYCNNSRVFFKGLDEFEDITEVRQLQIKLFLNRGDFDIICNTCALGTPPFIKLDFSSSKLINFSDLDDNCDLFEEDVDFNKVLQMSVDIEYAYDHTEKFNPKPRSIWEKIFGR